MNTITRKYIPLSLLIIGILQNICHADTPSNLKEVINYYQYVGIATHSDNRSITMPGPSIYASPEGWLETINPSKIRGGKLYVGFHKDDRNHFNGYIVYQGLIFDRVAYINGEYKADGNLIFSEVDYEGNSGTAYRIKIIKKNPNPKYPDYYDPTIPAERERSERWKMP